MNLQKIFGQAGECGLLLLFLMPSSVFAQAAANTTVSSGTQSEYGPNPSYRDQARTWTFTSSGAGLQAQNNYSWYLGQFGNKNSSLIYTTGSISFIASNGITAGNLIFTSNTANDTYTSGGAVSSGQNITFSGAAQSIQFLDNFASNYGGAMYGATGIALSVTTGSLVITGNVTSGSYGGAFNTGTAGSANITLSGSYGLINIANNRATSGLGGAFRSAGGISISNAAVGSTGSLTVANNFAQSGGGAFYATQGNVNVGGNFGGIAFTGNTANGNAGAIFASSAIGFTANTVNDMLFANNVTSSGAGGAMLAWGNISLLGNSGGNLAFQNNAASGGPGGAVYSNQVLTVGGTHANILLVSNTAIGEGGAWNANNAMIISATAAAFTATGNYANTSGGALYVGSGLGITGSLVFGGSYGSVTFANNKTNSSGGAIAAGNGSIFIGPLVSGTLSFSGNSSQGGGAISAGNAMGISGSYGAIVFGSNSSNGGNGGAILAGGNVTISATAAGALAFTGNTSNSNGGGAIYSSGGVVSFGGAYGSLLATGNNAGGGSGGGAFYGAQGVILNALVGGTLLLASNTSGNGGGGVIYGGVNGVSIGGTAAAVSISGNYGGGNGGAIESGGNVILSATTGTFAFTGNVSSYGGGGGGALYSAGSVLVGGQGYYLFQSNTATEGGAMSVGTGGTVAFTTGGSVNFSGNHNTYGAGGGAIYGAGALTVSDAVTGGALTFTSNTSSNNGGAIYSTGAFTLNVSTGTLTATGNKANNGNANGGFVFINGGSGVFNIASGAVAQIGSQTSVANQTDSIGAASGVNIYKTGGGLLALWSKNDYQGATIVRGGTLNVLGQITNSSGLIDGGIGEVTGSGWWNAPTLTVGGSVSGTFVVTDSGSVTTNNVTFGQNAGSHGTGTVSGSGYWYNNNGSFTVGAGGGASLTLNQTGSIYTQNGNATIGAPGSVTVSDTALWRGANFTNSGNLGLGQSGSLSLTGAYTQNATGTLTISLNAAAPNAPFITANTAALAGYLALSGFTGGALTGSAASDFSNSSYTIIHTTGGITGDLIANVGGATGYDFLNLGAHKANSDRDYVVGLGLAWYDAPASSHGNFTLGAGQSFDVDVILSDTTPDLGTTNASGATWDGKSLTVTASNSGTLTLSARNTYTGTTTVSGGALNITGTTDGNTRAVVGGAAGRSGTVSVSGSALWQVGAGGMDIGAAGDGLVTLSGGATLATGGTLTVGDQAQGVLESFGNSTLVTNGAVVIGHAAGVFGGVGIGADAASAAYWNAGSGSMVIAGSGTGVVRVGNSGSITGSGRVVIGAEAGGFGQAYVSDHAYWSVTNSVIAGADGYGQLIVGDSGSMSVSGSVIINMGGGGGAVWIGGTGSDGDATLTVGGDFINGADASPGLATALRVNGNGVLNVAGIYTQNDSAQLLAILDSTTRGPDDAFIYAGSAVLGGTLNVVSFNGAASGSSASGLREGSTLIISTSGGFGGSDFAVKNVSSAAASNYKFIILDGFASNDGSSPVGTGTNYYVGFELAWQASGSLGSGVFELDDGQSFDVDISLGNNSAAPAAGAAWDGRSLTKTGVGALFLTASNNYTGTTTVSAGEFFVTTLSGSGAGSINNSAAAIIDSGTAAVSGSGAWSATSFTVSAGWLNAQDTAAVSATALNVSGGLVSLNNSATLNAASGTVSGSGGVSVGGTAIWIGSSLTVSGGTLGVSDSGSVSLGGAYTQQGGGNLFIDLANRDSGRGAYINASTAALDGSLTVTGFEVNVTGTAASLLTNNSVLLLHTAAPGSISGSFANLIISGLPPGGLPDYITGGAYAVNNNQDYVLGFGLAWFSASSVSHGNFTLGDGAAFNVDVTLSDTNADLGTTNASGAAWDGRTLTKLGSGTLTLSASNAYTGSTVIIEGALLASAATANAADAINSSTLIVFNSTTSSGTLMFNQSATLSARQYVAAGAAGNLAQSSTTATLTVTAPAYNGNGGAVFVEAGGAYNIKGHAEFAGNSVSGANLGGAMYFAGNGALDFDDCNFLLTGNTAGSGGAIAMGASTGTLTVNGSSGLLTFGGNVATGSQGGAIYSADALNFTVSSGTLTFTGNTAAFDGAAMFARNNLNLSGTFGDFLIVSNTSGAGVALGTGTIGNGAIATGATGTLAITAQVAGTLAAAGNYAAGNGAALYAGALNFSGSFGEIIFASNTAAAGYYGGAIWAEQNIAMDAVSAGNITFSGNHASAAAGALGSSQGGVAINAVAGGTLAVTGNYAAGGAGAFYAYQTLTVSGSYGALLIDSNTTGGLAGAFGSYGAMAFDVTTAGDIDVTNNTAGGGGGALGSYDGVTVSAVAGGNLNFTGNTAGASGGAIGTAPTTPDGLAAASSDVIITATVAGTLNVSHNRSGTGANYNDGGAVYASRDVMFSGSYGAILFASNTAGSWGGAIYAQRDLTLDAVSAGDIVFDHNTSTGGDYGAFGTADGSTLISALAGGALIVTNNAAFSDFGGLGANQSLTVSGTYGSIFIDSNTAGRSVGALGAVLGSVVIDAQSAGALTVTNNVATGASGNYGVAGAIGSIAGDVIVGSSYAPSSSRQHAGYGAPSTRRTTSPQRHRRRRVFHHRNSPTSAAARWPSPTICPPSSPTTRRLTPARSGHRRPHHRRPDRQPIISVNKLRRQRRDLPSAAPSPFPARSGWSPSPATSAARKAARFIPAPASSSTSRPAT
ncbi:autotransporter-associated beta strand repeat-containing protein [Termitidicoccus mucosus]|uniref:beta strand repeat-containing protein n=1 Tax=Termitidicoccus mucosus TaxID=1184151 RepID=UPI003182E429